MRKCAIVTMLICTTAIVLSGCTNTNSELTEKYPELNGKSPEYKKGFAIGIQEAEDEIKNNKMTIYTYGYPPAHRNGIEFDKDTGLVYKTIAGCVVNDDVLGREAGHDKTIREHLKKRAP